MKKLVSFLTLLILMFALASCNQVNQLTDETAPELSGVEDLIITIGDSFNVLDGVSATDDIDGDITNEITYTITDDIGNVITLDINVAGDYYINYKIEDDAGNVTTATRKVTVSSEDEVNNAPVIVIESDVTIILGTPFVPLQGVTATDVEDGTITHLVQYEIYKDGSVVTNYSALPLGVYTVTYTVIDSGGLSNEVTRIVTVTEDGPDVIEHVRVDSISDAKLRLEEFFNDVLNATITTEEVCAKYIGDVPFPINDSTYEGCIEGLTEIEVALVSVSVGEVVEAESEGLPIYEAVVTVVGYDFEITAPLTFAFLSLQGQSENYIHFYGNPFLFEDGDDTEEEQAMVEYFYDSFFDVNYDVGTFCNDMLIPLTSGMVTYDECVEDVNYLRSIYISYEITDIYHTGSITLPDELVGELFQVEISLETTEGSYEFGIEIAVFVVDDNKFMAFTSFYLGNLNLNPDDLVIVEVTVEEASTLINEFYTSIFEYLGTSEQFCIDYINQIPFGPSQQECVEVIGYMMNEVSDLQVTSVVAEVIQINESMTINGFTVEISYVDGSGAATTGTTQFVVIGLIENPIVFLVDHPLGISVEDTTGFVTIPLDEVLPSISQIYTDMFGEIFTTNDFCVNYMSTALGDNPDFAVCERDVEYFKHFTDTYTLDNVTEISYFYQGNDITAYQVDVHVVNIHGETTDFVVVFGFFQDEFGINLLLLSYPYAYIGSDYNNAYLTLENAEIELAAIYADMLDPFVDANAFCTNYVTFDPNGPTVEECVDLLDYMRSTYDTILIGVVVDAQIDTEFETLNGFSAEVTLSQGATEHTFALQFIAVNDDLDYQVVFFDNPAGMDDSPGVELVDVTVDAAFEEIIDYYTDMLNVGVTSTVFCQQTHAYLPFEVDITQCINDIDNLRANIVAADVTGVVEISINQDGLSGIGYRATVELQDNGAVIHVITLDFAFAPTQLGQQLFLLGNPGIEVPEENYNFVVTDVTTAELKLTDMYDNIFNAALGTTDLCNAYTYGDPYGPTVEECVAAIDDIRTNYTGYSFTGLSASMIDWDGGEVVNGFVVTLTLVGVVEDKTFDLYFAIADPYSLGHLNFIFLGNPGGDTGPQFAEMTLIDATNWIGQYYDNVVSASLTDTLFCEVYFLLNSDMSEMDQSSCETIRSPYPSGGVTFTVDSVSFVAAVNDDPPHFIATIIMNDGSGDVSYSVNFFFLLDENEQIMLAVQLELSLGITPA